jgi:tetratricopeptide (TPR) repeat protein
MSDQGNMHDLGNCYSSEDGLRPLTSAIVPDEVVIDQGSRAANSSSAVSSVGVGYGQDLAARCQIAAQCYEHGRFDEAEQTFREIAKQDPKRSDVLHNLAVALARQGKHDEAVSKFRQSLQLRPGAAETHRNLGLALAQSNRLSEAEESYRRAIELQPKSARAYQELGDVLRISKKLDDSLGVYQAALKLDANSASVHYGMGMTLAAMGRKPEAKAAYQQALKLQPDFAEACNNLGILLEEEGLLDDAAACYRSAIRLQPKSDDALNNLGAALAAQRKFDEAIICYRQALSLNARSAAAHNNLGNALRYKGLLNESAACLQKAIELKADYPEAYNNLGITMMQQGLTPEATAFYDKALHFAADYAEPHLNRSLAWLSLGDFDRGWMEYEWRLKGKVWRTYKQPRLSIEAVEGRTVLLYYEQGIGDSLQFVRYAGLLKQRGARVLVQPHEALVKLLKHCPEIDLVLHPKDAPPAFDSHAPLLSLPAIFRTRTETIPANCPYIRTDSALVEAWRKKLQAYSGLKVGIAWQGNPDHRGDHLRSIPLKMFEPLLSSAGVQFFSLQKGFGREQLKVLPTGVSVVDLADQLPDFSDTAAAMQALDLVICCDTSVGHLAGAMGIPVWIAIPFASDWRWLRHRADSPWYPSARLFRQKAPNGWKDVLSKIEQELRRLGASKSKHAEGPGRAAALTHVHSGVSHIRDGKFADAAESFRLALEHDPTWCVAYHNLGVAMAMQKQLVEAMKSFRQAIELNPTYGEAHANLGLAMLERGQFAEALESMERAMANGYNSADIRNNYGVALLESSRPLEAIQSYRRALEIKPDYAEAHLNLSNALLSVGHYDEGWLEREWAWKKPGATARKLRGPRWSGENCSGKRILVHGENDPAVIVQLVRYAKLLKDRGATVLLECPVHLKDLLAEGMGVDEVCGLGEELPPFDAHVPLTSLPWIFGTRIHSVPAHVPYLTVDEPRRRIWAERLAACGGLKVGVVCQSLRAPYKRLIPLEWLAPFTRLNHIDFFSLSPSASASSPLTLPAQFESCEMRMTGDAVDYVDVAAFLKTLDLIICLDGDLPHMSGALGIPTWVVLNRGSDWKWMHGRDDSPWYPSLRLFRPLPHEEQAEIFQRLARELKMLTKPSQDISDLQKLEIRRSQQSRIMTRAVVLQD